MKNREAAKKIYVGLFLVVVFGWVAFDQLVKQAFASMAAGTQAGSILGGLVDLIVVHNTGAAWGIFAGNPGALGVFSLVVCAILVAYFFVTLNRCNLIKTIGLALIVAGGIGNAIDRFTHSYVLDFFATTFMDFPVFNVADIAVTCGVPLFLLGVFFQERSAKKPGE